MRIVDRLRRVLNPGRGVVPALSPRLLVMLAAAEDVELSCDEVFALIDEAAERAARGEDVAQLLPPLQAHLDRCPNCREQFEALLRVLAAE